VAGTTGESHILKEKKFITFLEIAKTEPKSMVV
jgi:hypothetical protein